MRSVIYIITILAINSLFESYLFRVIELFFFYFFCFFVLIFILINYIIKYHKHVFNYHKYILFRFNVIK